MPTKERWPQMARLNSRQLLAIRLVYGIHIDLIYFELQAIGDSCMPYGLIFYLSHLFAFSISLSFGMGYAACPSIILEWFNFCQGLRCIAGDCKADVSCCAPRLNG